MSRGVDVLTLGESMVAFHADVPWTEGSRATARVAGAESNVAIGLARLGHTVSWAGRVGADSFGDMVMTQLRGEGVRVDAVVQDAERPTGLMFVERRTADLARVEYRRAGSAGSALTTDDVDRALSFAPRVLHLTGITPALSASARESTVHAARTAKAAGALVSLDVNHRSRLWSREEAASALRVLVQHADVVVASDDELDLVGEGDEDTVTRQLLEGGARYVAVKRGSDGATLFSGHDRYDVGAFAVTAVDSFGAGDAFSAGLLSALLDDEPPEQCVRRGAVLGAFAVSTHGDWHGLPRRDELHLLDHLRSGSALR